MTLPKFLHAKGEYGELPNTLAKRVSFLREIRSIHINELSKKAMVEVDFIEAIEAGLETWLTVSVRQRISRILKVDPELLEEVEVKLISSDVEVDITVDQIKKISSEIMAGKKDIACPRCNSPLRVWIQEGFDLIDNPIRSSKAHCTECVFQLREE